MIINIKYMLLRISIMKVLWKILCVKWYVATIFIHKCDEMTTEYAHEQYALGMLPTHRKIGITCTTRSITLLKKK